MDSTIFKFDDENNGDVKLHIIGADGHPYKRDPIYLHSQILKKSRYFEARLSERWSSGSSSPEIILNIPLDGSTQNYIDCIHLMYSSQWKRQLAFLNVDDALRILPVASELLFEEGIRACMEYLEAVCWTPEQKIRIQALLSSLQVKIPTDLAERLQISKSHFDEELRVLKTTVPEMFSEILNKPFVQYGAPLQHMRETMKKQIVGYFQEDIHRAIQKICRDALLNEFRLRIEGIKCGSSTDKRDSACESFLWLLDLIKLCKRDVFEDAFTIFVEDEGIADILGKPQISWSLNTTVKRTNHYNLYPKINTYQNFSLSDRSYASRVLEILVHRFLDALANGDIIIPKRARVCFLIRWVPVMAYLICWYAGVHNERELIDCPSSYNPLGRLKFCDRFEGGVTKILASLPLRDQREILESLNSTAKRYQTWEGGIFRWWIKAIWMEVMAANGSHLQIE